MQDIKNRGNYGGGRTTVGIQEPSILPAPFLCKPKIALENKAYSCMCFFVCVFFASLHSIWDSSLIPTRDQTCVPCNGSAESFQWTTREVPRKQSL